MSLSAFQTFSLEKQNGTEMESKILLGINLHNLEFDSTLKYATLLNFKLFFQILNNEEIKSKKKTLQNP